MAYVIARSRKAGARYTGMYLDPDGTYKSAGTPVGDAADGMGSRVPLGQPGPGHPP
jgi:hypothetical protein